MENNFIDLEDCVVESGRDRADYSKVFNFSDKANSDLWLKFTNGNFVYNHTAGKWYKWTDKRWSADEKEECRQSIAELAAEMKKEALFMKNIEQQNKLLKFAIKLENTRNWESLLRAAMVDSTVAKIQKDFDSKPNFINLRNGRLNSDSMFFAPDHRRYDFITHLIDIEYDTEAKCPRWERFLTEVFNNNTELIGFIRKAIGYTMTASVSEQVMFFLFGGGSNGKSVFIDILQALLGTYSIKIPVSALMINKNSNDSKSENEKARLQGKRLLIASETEENQRLAESVVKDLTGGDSLTARFLYGQTFEFNPSHKLWMYGNHKPTIKGTDNGIWRRIRLIPFEAIFSKDDRDPDLTNKLKEELPGILQWTIYGLNEWKKSGLGNTPKAIKEATAEFRQEQDIVAEFLEQCTERSDIAETPQNILFKRFQQWQDDTGNRTSMNTRVFTNKLKAKGYRSEKGTGNKRKWIGLKIDK